MLGCDSTALDGILLKKPWDPSLGGLALGGSWPGAEVGLAVRFEAGCQYS